MKQTPRQTSASGKKCQETLENSQLHRKQTDSEVRNNFRKNSSDSSNHQDPRLYFDKLSPEVKHDLAFHYLSNLSSTHSINIVQKCLEYIEEKVKPRVKKEEHKLYSLWSSQTCDTNATDEKVEKPKAKISSSI